MSLGWCYLSGNFEGDGNDVVIAKLVESGYFAFHDVETLQIWNTQIRIKNVKVVFRFNTLFGTMAIPF